MRLGRHVKYWGRNAFVWTGISLACMLGFWLLNELGNAQYMQGADWVPRFWYIWQ